MYIFILWIFIHNNAYQLKLQLVKHVLSKTSNSKWACRTGNFHRQNYRFPTIFSTTHFPPFFLRFFIGKPVASLTYVESNIKNTVWNVSNGIYCNNASEKNLDETFSVAKCSTFSSNKLFSHSMAYSENFILTFIRTKMPALIF